MIYSTTKLNLEWLLKLRPHFPKECLAKLRLTLALKLIAQPDVPKYLSVVVALSSIISVIYKFSQDLLNTLSTCFSPAKNQVYFPTFG